MLPSNPRYQVSDLWPGEVLLAPSAGIGCDTLRLIGGLQVTSAPVHFTPLLISLLITQAADKRPCASPDLPHLVPDVTLSTQVGHLGPHAPPTPLCPPALS